MTIKAHCKINIGLRVLRRREDGYHDLETVMYPVRGLYDLLSVDAKEGAEVTFESCGIVVDCPAEQNLCVRAARLMQQRYGVGGVHITLDKRVPFGAGLGGGSADATAVIVAMNDIFALGLDDATLVSLAAELGSDTPFFVFDTPQLCRGRGEIMSPIDVDIRGMWLVVAKPEGEGVSTAEAYSGVRPALVDDSLAELLSLPVEEWQGRVVNDFEPHIFVAHPRIEALKGELLSCGATYAAMSGSGSAVFALFDHEPHLSPLPDTFVHVEELVMSN